MAADEDTTDETIAVLTDLLRLPPGSVLHYAIVVECLHEGGRGLAQRYCGMAGNAIGLHAMAVQSLAANQADMDVSKMTAGCTACYDEAPEK